MKISSKEDGNTINVFLDSIKAESEQIEIKMLKKAGQEMKMYIVQNLNMHRRSIDRNFGTPAMADDVVLRTSKDKYGDRVIKVSGGKATGSLWHIVNDGTYRSTPTHFMDSALQKVDSIMNSLWEQP